MQAGCPLGHIEVYGDSGLWELNITWGEVYVLKHATGTQVLAEIERLKALLDQLFAEIVAPIEAAFRVITAAGK
jgi:hypothetical protein